MALFDEDERKIMIGAVLGVAAVSLLRGIFPMFRGLGRPIAKATIKSGIVLYEKGRESMAHLGESLEDLVAEAKAELATESAPPAPAPGSGPGQVQ